MEEGVRVTWKELWNVQGSVMMTKFVIAVQDFARVISRDALACI